jgi:hypothetical protein
MAPRTAPKPRPAPDVLPDSLPGKDRGDALPDDFRRADQPETTPDSLPRIDENAPLNGRPSQDGGIAQHPIRDEDLEDRKPEDYVAEIAKAEEESWLEHPEGSAPPLDRLTQDRTPETERR